MSGRTIFARVESNSNGDFDTAELDGGGDIWLHPGFWGSTNDYLKQGTKLTAPVPASSDSWAYETRTDFTPAIACGDANVDGSGGYNCLLAWTNKGMALSAGTTPATILYIFFRVDAGGGIEFKNETVKIRGGSDAASAPALAYFAGKMWLAWKTVNSANTGGVPRVRIQNSSYAYQWTTVHDSDPLFIVDPPTFLYEASREAATVWTISK